MNKQRKHFLLWALLVVVATLLAEYLIFGRILLHPNSRLIMDNTDGRQIYFNILYHIKYGSGFVLSNQNYPYYECMFMTDAQAMLAFVLNWIQHHVCRIDHIAVGIINGLIFYSIPLCSLFLFLIFRNLQIRHWIAALFALLLCFLSPQMLRITAGHYGLSYLFYFPMMIWCLFRIMDGGRLAWMLSLVVLVIIMGLNNGHLSLAGSMLLVVFGLVGLFYTHKKGKAASLVILSTGLFCLLAFYLIIHHYDKVTDREAIPWGYLYYYAQFESIFLPFAGKVLDFYKAIWPGKVEIAKEEGIAYVGIVGFIMLFFMLWRMMLFLAKKKWHRVFRPTLNVKVNILLLSGFLILLYAMAFPFRYGMQSLLEHLNFIRQFRSPGRFAWVFYYAFGMYIAYQFNVLLRCRTVSRRRYLVPLLVLLPLLLYLQDIADYTTWYKRYIIDNTFFDNTFTPQADIGDFVQKNQIDTMHFSSIYGIPVCNQWNSKFGREDEQYKLVTVMTKLSYATSLPWINSKLSRVSTSQTMASGQFVSSPLITREIEPLIDPHKAILLITLKGYTPLPSEQYVIDHARKIDEDAIYCYYSFRFAPGFYALRDSLRQHFDEGLAQTASMRDALRARGSLIMAYAGEGEDGQAVSDAKSDKLILDTIVVKPEGDSTMQFSIWSVVDYRTDGAPYIQLVRSTPDNTVFDMQYLHSARAIDVQQGKLKLEYVYRQTLPKEKVRVLILKGKNHRFERLLIRPQGFTDYERCEGKRIVNNYLLD